MESPDVRDAVEEYMRQVNGGDRSQVAVNAALVSVLSRRMEGLESKVAWLTRSMVGALVALVVELLGGLPFG